MIKHYQSFLFLTVLLSLVSSRIKAQVDFSSSYLPIVFLETFGQEIPDDPRIIAQMSIIDNGSGNLNTVSDPYNGYQGHISIEIRGTTSQSFPKKQYALETQFEDGSNRNVSLLGLPVENDWILAAPYADKTLMRNVLAFEISRRLGQYAPRTAYCELVLNGEYMGVYVLTEKIKRDRNRVDIAELDSDDTDGDELTGGYLLKIDQLTASTCEGWITDEGIIRIQHEDPKCDEVNSEQVDYIKNFFSDFEEALYSANFEDSQNGYRKFLNVSKAVDYLIVNELTKNIDAYRLSTFFSKDRDSNGGKVDFGPVWDFNVAFGNAYYLEAYNQNKIIAEDVGWWQRFLQDSTFQSAISDRWIELRRGELCDYKLLGLIDSISNVLEAPQRRNFQKWQIMGEYVWPNYFIGETYVDEVDYLKSWLFRRLSWLDDEFAGGRIACDRDAAIANTVFPNPFDQFISCSFTLNRKGKVNAALYDLSGKLVYTLINDQEFQEGQHLLSWNFDDFHSEIKDSVYILILDADGRNLARAKVVKISR